MYLGECVGNKVRSYLLQFVNTIVIIVIHWELNGKNGIVSHTQLEVWYTDLKHWLERMDLIHKNCGPIEPSILTSMFKCTLNKYQLNTEYMGLYTYV